jgi:4'-phosphopantetheinyl transferase EntD
MQAAELQTGDEQALPSGAQADANSARSSAKAREELAEGRFLADVNLHMMMILAHPIAHTVRPASCWI